MQILNFSEVALATARLALWLFVVTKNVDS
jgi:hypothetical protein